MKTWIANLNIQIIQEIEKSIIGYKDWYTEEDYSFSFHPIPPKERPKQSTHWSKEKVEEQREKRRLVLQESIKDYDYELIRYVSAETPVTLKCKKCGNEWTATRYRMQTGKTSCPICFPVEKTPKKQRLTEEEKVEKRRNQFIDKIYKKSDETIRIDSYCGAKQRTQATCLTCGYTWSPVAEHLMQKCWCPQCKKEGRIVVENNKIERNT